MRSYFRILSSIRLVGTLVALGAVLTSAHRAVRAEDSAPSVNVVQSGADNLFGDLKFLFSLTTEQEQKQFDIIKGYIEDGFLAGVDRKEPVLLELKFGNPSTRQVWSIPIDNINTFRNVTLKGLAIVPKLKAPNLYELSKTFKGWMKFAQPYVSIGETQEDLPAGDPRNAAVKALIAKNYDVAVEARNSKTDSAAQDARRKNFANTRKELLGALKKKKEETDADFDLKKKVLESQFDEGERFFVESENLLLGWTTDAEKSQGRLDVELSAIPGTSLEKVIGELGTTPSYFANIARSENPIFSGRLNHPLDEPRRKSLTELAVLLRDRAKSDADGYANRSAEEKAATKNLADKIFDMLTAGLKAGIADGFIEVHANASGKNTLVGGFRTADGTAVVDILKILPESKKGRQTKLDADAEGDVKIHEVTVSETDHPHYQSFFGGTVLYVGSSKEAVWCAAGENALAELKAAIKKRSEPGAAPATDAPFGQIYVKLLPWIKLREERDPKQGSPKMRKISLEAFGQGDDIVSGEIRRVDKKLVGQLTVQTGILRFAGKATADFSRENLDDTPQTPKKAAKNP